MSYSLVLHPDCSQLDTIITKVNTLNKKSGPFDALFLVGDIKNNVSCNEKLSFDLPAYYTGGKEDVTDDDHRLDKTIGNLTYLGNHGLFTSTDGMKVGYVNGNEEYLSSHASEIEESLKSSNIDILLTFQWAKAIAEQKKLFVYNSNIDRFVEASQPKYHFACGSSTGKFYEMVPFQWESGNVTRFISLAKFGGTEKWIYAFNLNPSSLETPKNLSDNPFTLAKEQKSNEVAKRGSEFEEERLTKKPKSKIVAPEDCFFCLSNPKLQSHMIVSIGEHAYLTIAKGPLTRPTDLMKFSGHCLIIPIEHTPSLEPSSESESVIKTPLYNEILRYQASLIKLFASFNLGTIFFHINKSQSIHLHIQAFPIPTDFLIDFETYLKKNAQINNTKYKRSTRFKFEKFNDSSDENYLEMINSKKDYIQFQVFDLSIKKQTIYISYIEEDKVLDLQFGRRVLAYLLQTPKRVKWDQCQQSIERETTETETFKDNYKSFDFTASL
jgi:hypothetical protein